MLVALLKNCKLNVFSGKVSIGEQGRWLTLVVPTLLQFSPVWSGLGQFAVCSVPITITIS